MFASFDPWLFEGLAGVARAPGSRGWGALRVAPPGPRDGLAGLTWAAADVDTPLGRAGAAWAAAGGGAPFALRATVPPGARADVVLPFPPGAATVREGGAPVWRGGAFVAGVDGVGAGAAEGGSVVLRVGSGVYEFTVEV